ncbi:hypothetical protein [Aquipuribacter hungaricus]|uniref:Uncharacterized protein n=1 Tax=Aquipuribacter hungaricus TaxID=545624 RepID=A0ABV7WNL3_9MICO
MSVETDGVEEAFEGQLRVLLTAAGQVGERLARVREDTLRRAQADSERDTRELRLRVQAEQQAARAQLSGVYRPGWWEQAGHEQIASTYQLARAWAHDDPEAVRAEQHIRQEVRARYGIDLDAVGVDPVVEREAVQRLREPAPAARSASQMVEQSETALLMAQAGALERAAGRGRADGRVASGSQAVGFDSPTRRHATAAALVEVADIDPETVAKRMRADVSQAEPASAATAAAVQPAPRARRTRDVSPDTQRSAPAR